MKRTIHALLILAALICATRAIAEDVTKSFSGIIWGISADKVGNLEQVRQDGDIRSYQRAGDFYRLGDVNLENISYAFYQDRYFAAFMPVTKKADIQAILATLNKQYGPARAQLRVDRNIYIWEYMEIKIKLKQYLANDDAKLAFYFTPISTAVNAARGGSTSTHVFKLDKESEEIDF